MAMTRDQAKEILRLDEVGFDVLVQALPPGPGFLEASVHAQAEAVGRVLGERVAFANLPPEDRRLLIEVGDELDAERAERASGRDG